ncbi:MAG: M56 family metallopeptidase [Bacteroidales bacterium]|nr:M56 family metallopeptidase [Bacteroidales bacterium]
MIRYLIISSIYMAAFYTLFLLLASRDTHYRRNRSFLLLAIMFSLLLPLFEIQLPAVFVKSVNTGLGSIISLGEVNIYSQPGMTSPAGSLKLLYIIYFSGCLLALLTLFLNALKLGSLVMKHRVKGTRIVLTPPGRESGFSAAGFVFINSGLNDDEKNTILEHELSHIDNKHFFDTILVRLTGVIFWFNPFIYMYERSLKAIHEFEADDQMLRSGRNVLSYQRLILNQIFNTNIFTLQNGFSGPSLIKKRMIMMTKKRSNKLSGLKLLLIIPFITAIFVFFSCTEKETNQVESIDEPETILKSEETITAISKEKLTETEQPKSKAAKTSKSGNGIFVVVEDMPEFMGGDVNKFRNWVQQNVTYPKIAAENGIQGKVFIMFVVNEQGNVEQAEIMRGVDPILDKEALRIVRSSPVWKVGRQKGKAVPVRFSITVNFQMQ